MGFFFHLSEMLALKILATSASLLDEFLDYALSLITIRSSRKLMLMSSYKP